MGVTNASSRPERHARGAAHHRPRTAVVPRRVSGHDRDAQVRARARERVPERRQVLVADLGRQVQVHRHPSERQPARGRVRRQDVHGEPRRALPAVRGNDEHRIGRDAPSRHRRPPAPRRRRRHASVRPARPRPPRPGAAGSPVRTAPPSPCPSAARSSRRPVRRAVSIDDVGERACRRDRICRRRDGRDHGEPRRTGLEYERGVRGEDPADAHHGERRRLHHRTEPIQSRGSASGFVGVAHTVMPK